MTTVTRKYLDWALIISCNFMWATQVSVIKLIGDRLGPVAITFLPMIFSTLIFLPALWYEARKRGTGFHWRWADTKHFLTAGIFGTFLIQFTYTLGSQRTLAANAGIITLTIPVFVALAASLISARNESGARVELRARVGGRDDDIGRTSAARASAAPAIWRATWPGGLRRLGLLQHLLQVTGRQGYTELEILVYSSIVASAASVPLFVWLEPLRSPL